MTAGFAIGRHFPLARVMPYWFAQVAGALVASSFLQLSLGSVAAGVTRPAGSDIQSFVWEAVLTFILVIVIVSVATDVRAVGHAAAIAIGGAVALGSLVGGPVSGASMNPVRSLGPALVSGNLTDLWIYLTAPFVGAIVATVLYGHLRSSAARDPHGEGADLQRPCLRRFDSRGDVTVD